ncbi:hypothetical protein [Naasia lichenicola]|uniref:Uncharacterized protein n=1 Tax=Naasia lichenicola TaxID=2565933 RepID=A0A4S4FH70_9MICO|nr:hypothetical protein [Naasia lichenicola]THG29318.1 hypothetical protein E6C64_11395 [Naasia lichenicola]
MSKATPDGVIAKRIGRELAAIRREKQSRDAKADWARRHRVLLLRWAAQEARYQRRRESYARNWAAISEARALQIAEDVQARSEAKRTQP